MMEHAEKTTGTMSQVASAERFLLRGLSSVGDWYLDGLALGSRTGLLPKALQAASA